MYVVRSCGCRHILVYEHFSTMDIADGLDELVEPVQHSQELKLSSYEEYSIVAESLSS